LGNVEAAQRSFEHYFLISLDKIEKQQASTRVLSATNLNSEDIGIEITLAKAQEQRLQMILLVLVTFLGSIALGYLTFGRTYQRKLATDLLTGLSNAHSVMAKIKKVKAPIDKKVNALALFDVSHFITVNAEYGYKAGEIALKQVAECLNQVTREKGIVGCVGIDQFIVCLVNVEDVVAKELFSKVQKGLADLSFKVGATQKIDINPSMHVYSSVTSFSDAEDVLAEICHVLRKA
jgi:diguanylate cyclase (GGDEF)-like protein